jgi:cysteine desulfurase
MHANNETGMIQPVRVAADIAHEAGALLHSDAVQSFGKIAVSVDDLQVDLLTMSAHKLYGPKGIGVLYVRNGTRIDPMLHGGGQEGGRRAGTENVAAAVGFATAVGLAAARRDRDAKDLHGIRSRFIAHLLERFPGLVLNGSVGNALPTIVNVSFDSSAGRIDGDALIMGMDMRGVAVTSGSACTSGSLQASHVLLAMGRSPETARATVRFSFGRSTTDDECRRAADTLEDVVAMMEERPR